MPSMHSPTFTLRLATSTDASALSEIAARTFVDTYGYSYTEKDLADYLADAYEVEKIRAEIEDPMRHTVLLFSEDDLAKPCGYAMLREGSIRTGDEGPSEDYLEIKRLYIDKPYHGKGAAYVLMDYVMEIVKQKNRKVAWLGVWENNFRGQKFYRKFGFEETGAHVFMVGATKDRDLIFTLNSPGSL